MGDNIEAKSDGDTNFAKNGGIAINNGNLIVSSLSGFQEKNVIPEHLDRLREAPYNVSELQREMSELRKENLSLRKENKELQDRLEIKNKMKFERPFYYAIDGDNKDGPFCPKCWEDENKPIRLKDFDNDDYECPKCQNTFRGPNYQTHFGYSLNP